MPKQIKAEAGCNIPDEAIEEYNRRSKGKKFPKMPKKEKYSKIKKMMTKKK